MHRILERPTLLAPDETSLLLTISQTIAAVRDRKELFTAIFEHINPVIPVDDTGLVVLDKTGNYWQDWTNVDNYQGHQAATRLQQMGYDQFLPMDRFTEYTLNHTGVLTVTQFRVQYPEHPFGEVMWEAGISELLFTPLMHGGQKLGVLFLDSEQEGTYTEAHLRLSKTIADLIAVAVANILANEEVQRLNEQLQEQNAYLIEEVEQQYNLGEMVGQSPALQNLHHNLRLVAPTDTTVLIQGESGTGKELVARALHQASSRRAKPLIKINCAALLANLIESELFGHERGAFTGATDRRIGKFELAHGSTLFLDEIGELPLDLQAKLLRAIQEKEIERLGGNKVISTDVRIISATNRHLAAEVQAGRFRADLYYRLSVFPLSLPPLRERPDDLPLLVGHFVQKMAQRLGKPLQGVSGRAMRQVMAYDWPGNIRELENVLERAAILSPGRVIPELYLPTTKPGSSAKAGITNAPVAEEYALKTAADNERDHILRALHYCKGKVSGRGGAAELLQMKASTLEFRMKKLGIRREHVRVDPSSSTVN